MKKQLMSARKYMIAIYNQKMSTVDTSLVGGPEA